MRNDPRIQAVSSVPLSRVSRRVMLTSAAKLAGGAALAGALGIRVTELAAAQEEIILTAAASEVGARPGAGYAHGSAAIAAGSSTGVVAQGAVATGAGTSGPAAGGAATGGPSSGTGTGPGDQTGTGGGDQMPPAGGDGGGGAGTGGGGGAGTGGGDQSPGY